MVLAPSPAENVERRMMFLQELRRDQTGLRARIEGVHASDTPMNMAVAMAVPGAKMQALRGQWQEAPFR